MYGPFNMCQYQIYFITKRYVFEISQNFLCKQETNIKYRQFITFSLKVFK